VKKTYFRQTHTPPPPSPLQIIIQPQRNLILKPHPKSYSNPTKTLFQPPKQLGNKKMIIREILSKRTSREIMET